MTTVLCQHPIDNKQKGLLCQEFPHCRFIFSQGTEAGDLLPGHLRLAEIFFGDRLTDGQLEQASHLRWVQAPQPDLRQLPLAAMKAREDILVTAVERGNERQVGEYVMGVLLCCSKHLLQWALMDHETLWESSLRDDLWSLRERIFVQVGLGKVGTEIVRRAKQLGMRVRGVHHNRSYNPYCDRILAEQELHSILPVADVVSLALPYAWRYYHSYGKDELELMKEGSILIATGAGGVVDEEALAKVAAKGKFRSVVLDCVESVPLPRNSPLWGCDNVVITPSVAESPRGPELEVFRVFRRNLRHFLPGNYAEMRGKVDLNLWQRTAISGRKTF